MAGCDAVAASSTPSSSRVSTSLARWPGATLSARMLVALQRCFQPPHPARWPRRPTPSGRPQACASNAFQPSPGAMAGCDVVWFSAQAVLRSSRFQESKQYFNPHRRDGRVRPRRAGTSRHAAASFNLTRRDGRVRLQDTRRKDSMYMCFNPHPAMAGCDALRCSARCRLMIQLQPSPGAMAGCDARQRPCLATTVFQPSPGAMAGCDVRNNASDHRHREFQPSPGAMAGCDGHASPGDVGLIDVSTSPARWPGATPNTSMCL